LSGAAGDLEATETRFRLNRVLIGCENFDFATGKIIVALQPTQMRALKGNAVATSFVRLV
jgi:hypothetical protein